MVTGSPSWTRNHREVIPSSSYAPHDFNPNVPASSAAATMPQKLQAPPEREPSFTSLPTRKTLQQGFPQSGLGGTALEQVPGIGGSGWQLGCSDGVQKSSQPKSCAVVDFLGQTACNGIGLSDQPSPQLQWLNCHGSLQAPPHPQLPWRNSLSLQTPPAPEPLFTSLPMRNTLQQSFPQSGLGGTAFENIAGLGCSDGAQTISPSKSWMPPVGDPLPTNSLRLPTSPQLQWRSCHGSLQAPPNPQLPCRNGFSLQTPPAPGQLFTSLPMRKTLQQGFPQSGLGGTGSEQVAGLGCSDGTQTLSPSKSWMPTVGDPLPNSIGLPAPPSPQLQRRSCDGSLRAPPSPQLPWRSGLSLRTAPAPEPSQQSELGGKEPKVVAFSAPTAAPVQGASLPPPGRCRKGCVMRLKSSSCSRQHPWKHAQKIPNADATEESPRLLGICDGVSGCIELGISPDALPHEILLACHDKSSSWFDKIGPVGHSDGRWLCQLMQEAYSSTRALGATTILLGCILDNGLLVTANVGDCALLVLRVHPADRNPRTQAIFKTQATRHEGTKHATKPPFQIQRLPHLSDSDSKSLYTLQNAKCDTCMLQPGDYLVLGSDGIFDNLQDREIQEIIERHCPMGGAPKTEVLAEAARALVDAAIAHVSQLLGNGMSPSEHCNPDDTTALVASVVEVPDGDEFDSWFWRQRGIQQPYQDRQSQWPNNARSQTPQPYQDRQSQRPNIARSQTPQPYQDRQNSRPNLARMQTGPQRAPFVSSLVPAAAITTLPTYATSQIAPSSYTTPTQSTPTSFATPTYVASASSAASFTTPMPSTITTSTPTYAAPTYYLSTTS